MSKKILLIFLGLLLSIVIFEIGLRLGGVILLSVQRHHNMQALKQKGTYRILCLGESTTQGQYPGFLNEILNQNDIGIKFSVIDRGLVGTNSLLIINRLERNIDEYRPDMVVVMMGINDKDSILPYGMLPKSRFKMFFQSLRTYKLMKLLWLRIRHPFKKDPDLNLDDETSYIELAGAYRRIGKIVDVKHLNKALAFNLNNYEAYIELGEAYAKIGRIPEVERAFKKAIALNPEVENKRRIFKNIAMIHELRGEDKLAERYYAESEKLGSKMYNSATEHNFRKLKEILDKRGIRLVCVQYPMSNVETLKQIFRGDDKGIIFVDNESLFKEAVKKEGYWIYFRDTFGGQFGHCTDKGNRFLAENISDAILREVFNK